MTLLTHFGRNNSFSLPFKKSNMQSNPLPLAGAARLNANAERTSNLESHDASSEIPLTQSAAAISTQDIMQNSSSSSNNGTEKQILQDDNNCNEWKTQRGRRRGKMDGRHGVSRFRMIPRREFKLIIRQNQASNHHKAQISPLPSLLSDDSGDRNLVGEQTYPSGPQITTNLPLRPA